MFVCAVYPFFALYANPKVNVGFFIVFFSYVVNCYLRSYCKIFLLFLSQKPLTRSRQDFKLLFLSQKPLAISR